MSPRNVVEEIESAELFLHPGDGHLFADDGLDDYDEKPQRLYSRSASSGSWSASDWPVPTSTLTTCTTDSGLALTVWFAHCQVPPSESPCKSTQFVASSGGALASVATLGAVLNREFGSASRAQSPAGLDRTCLLRTDAGGDHDYPSWYLWQKRWTRARNSWTFTGLDM
jgi:hypothetical protein